MYRVVYLTLAEADILDAVDYIADKLANPVAAEALLDELDRMAEQLARSPYSFQLYRTERPMRDEIRMAPVKGFVLYYTVRENTVEVRRLLHGRRDRSRPED